MRKRSTGQNTSPPSLKTPAVPWVYLNLHGKIPLLDVNKYFGWQPETFLFYFVLRKFILYFYLLAAIDRKWYYEDLQVCGNNTSQVSKFWLFEIVRSTLVTELTFLIYQTAWGNVKVEISNLFKRKWVLVLILVESSPRFRENLNGSRRHLKQ